MVFCVSGKGPCVTCTNDSFVLLNTYNRKNMHMKNHEKSLKHLECLVFRAEGVNKCV